MDPVVHFEMPYDDAARVGRFYAEAFGWRTADFPGAGADPYVVATTTASDAGGRPTEPGAINGGFFRRKPDWPAQHPGVVVAVEDLGTSMARVGAAGGHVLGDPVDLPGVGRYVSFVDTEGNRVAMLQPLPRK